jgi:hypothetical protein
MKPMLSAAAAILLTACSSMTPAPGPPPAAWTQFGLGDEPQLIARVLIADGASCPSITIDGVTTTMQERKDPRSAVFGRLCEERRPLADRLRVRIAAGNRLLLEQDVTRQPQAIAVLGDTGCRVQASYDQHCDKADKWPFAQVAGAAATRAPQLVVHLGDYYYREAPCSNAPDGCTTPPPFGDRVDTWRAEFFEPARPLLARAPWLFVRGNHEDCARGGKGWAYYFGDGGGDCDPVHGEAIVRLAGLTLINIDSSHADDPAQLATVNAAWQASADSIVPKLSGSRDTIVLVTHIPQYVVCPAACDKVRTANIGGVRTLADRLRATGRPVLLLAGHFHAFQEFDAPGIRQLIVGNGGANLDPFADATVAPPRLTSGAFQDWRRSPQDLKTIVGGRSIAAQVQSWAVFGFTILSPAAMELVMYDAAGSRQFACDLAGRATPPCR